MVSTVVNPPQPPPQPPQPQKHTHTYSQTRLRQPDHYGAKNNQTKFYTPTYTHNHTHNTHILCVDFVDEPNSKHETLQFFGNQAKTYRIHEKYCDNETHFAHHK